MESLLKAVLIQARAFCLPPIPPAMAASCPTNKVTESASSPESSGVYADLSRQWIDRCGEDGGRGFRRQGETEMPIEIVSANHQNKPDIAANHRQGMAWTRSGGVDVIRGTCRTRPVALAVSEIAKGQERSRP